MHFVKKDYAAWKYFVRVECWLNIPSTGIRNFVGG